MRGRVRGAPFLYVVVFLASSITQPASTYYFNEYIKWANAAFNGGPAGPSGVNCTFAAVDFLDFVYAVIAEVAPTVGTAQITHTCLTCSSSMDAALSLIESTDPSACPLLPKSNMSRLTAAVLRRFTCFGADVGGNGSNSSGAAGSCVVEIARSLRSIQLLDRVATLDPSLRFSGSLLGDLCTALWPPSPPAPVSCCPRSWALLMGALTQQACISTLSQEYASLPGRCESVLNRTVPGYCEANWPTDLLPLLAAPQAALCDPGPPPTRGTPAGWLNGSLCTSSQLRRSQPVTPSSALCDLTCGLLGDMQRVLSGEIPGPQNSNNNNLSSNSTTTTSSTPAATDTASGGDNGKRKLQTATIVIAVIFSVIIAALLIALAIFSYTIYKEKRLLKREQYQFDLDIRNAIPETEAKQSQTPQQTPRQLPATSAVTTTTPTDSNQTQPRAFTPQSDSMPTDPDTATKAAAASASTTTSAAEVDAADNRDVLQTPRYMPDLSLAATGPTSPGDHSQLSDDAQTPRSAAFDSSAVPTAAGPGTATSTTAAADFADNTPLSSRRHGSAEPLSDVSQMVAGKLSNSSSPASYKKLVRMASAGSAPAIGVAASPSLAAEAMAAERLCSHHLSLTDSEATQSIYHTAFESYSAAGGASGSYTTARSTYGAVGGSSSPSPQPSVAAYPPPGTSPQ